MPDIHRVGIEKGCRDRNQRQPRGSGALCCSLPLSKVRSKPGDGAAQREQQQVSGGKLDHLDRCEIKHQAHGEQNPTTTAVFQPQSHQGQQQIEHPLILQGPIYLRDNALGIGKAVDFRSMKHTPLEIVYRQLCHRHPKFPSAVDKHYDADDQHGEQVERNDAECTRFIESHPRYLTVPGPQQLANKQVASDHEENEHAHLAGVQKIHFRRSGPETGHLPGVGH